jgi:hypothetical protein
MSGYLQKKNSHNVWQKRFFYLNNDYLIYKKDESTPNTDLKGVIDVREIASVMSLTKGDISITMKGGESLLIKSTDWKESTKWINAINQRIEWIAHENTLIKDNPESAELLETYKPVSLSGWLQKKSPHKYGGMQV